MAFLMQFDGDHVPTESDAFSYRLKAAQLGRMARSESDEARMLQLLHEALSWIELAQNEEYLTASSEPRRLQ